MINLIQNLIQFIFLNKQINKIKEIDYLVDGYMTQITLNTKKSAKFLKSMCKYTKKDIYLGISAPTTKKLDLMYIRTQLYYICNNKKFLNDESFIKIYSRILCHPLKWYKILSLINIGMLDMLWRFRLTRKKSYIKLIDDLKNNLDNNINIHYNSGGQENSESIKYIKILKKLL